ncbi:NAD(P)H-hydrate epimerase [Corynebacterium poyangense]|uniref:ADP-dependent (S)-NAD(P)H-hydrate dehydratase n=1 Tax=Corynebacterium poyangense TaxID=2684405 RepID=A0A7H0SRX5_9CORY|nr:NAD(P)H-hydrate epimerase [Corynebacterium poyangense]QNQ91300.1 NAD(P)H-hydrate epimerase [Corynebacterium poyangense]
MQPQHLAAPLFRVAHIRAAEAPLLQEQTHPDQLMRSAAHAVAETAQMMLRRTDCKNVLLLVGSGGNGGDALYAGVELLSDGVDVAAYLLYPEKTYQSAWEAFCAAGGRAIDQHELTAKPWGLVIDGLLGIGARGGLRAEAQDIVAAVSESAAPVLAVDIPSGVDADTGHAGQLHLSADLTVTFGGLRYAHALSPTCGLVLLGNPHLPGQLQRSIQAELATDAPSDAAVLYAWRTENIPDLSEPRRRGASLEPIPLYPRFPRQEPSIDDDKYSGGVVGIAAGSAKYRGAATLCTAGALRATSSMVRYAGDCWERVVATHPEVVATATLTDCGRVQTWVFGPGRGLDSTAREELSFLLAQPEPLIIDADGISLLAQDSALLGALKDSTSTGRTIILTPHAGEFSRLAAAINTGSGDSSMPDVENDSLLSVRSLAGYLGATILLKGRTSIISTEQQSLIVNCGNSWAATPGSGDVLAGVLGALVARYEARNKRSDTDVSRETLLDVVGEAVILHARAAALASENIYGQAPISAVQLAKAIPLAWTKELNNPEN